MKQQDCLLPHRKGGRIGSLRWPLLPLMRDRKAVCLVQSASLEEHLRNRGRSQGLVEINPLKDFFKR